MSTVVQDAIAKREAETYRWNPFDLTKVWPHKDYVLRLVKERSGLPVHVEPDSTLPPNLFSNVTKARAHASQFIEIRRQLTTKKGTRLAVDSFRDHHAANRLNLDSATGDVANRALPLAQLRNPVICSTIVLDSGTNSFSASAMERSVGSLSSPNAW